MPTPTLTFYGRPARDFAPRFVRAWARVWPRLPAPWRQRLLWHWAHGQPEVNLYSREQDRFAGRCCSHGFALQFWVPHMAGLDDGLLDALVAHELAHAILSAYGWRQQTERQTDRLVESAGFDMARLRGRCR